MGGEKKKKQVRTSIEPKTGKVPRSKDEDLLNRNISFRVGMMDTNWSYGWDKVDSDTFWSDIYPRLKDFESMKLSQILINDRSNHHNISRSKLIRDAQKRLDDIGLDDLDEVFSLRLTGKHRIFGKLSNAVLNVIWWDPKHEICPSIKKNT